MNKIRTYVKAPQIATAPTLKDLLDERGREFFDENWRRNDLIRFGNFESGFDTYKEMFDYVQKSKYFNPELFKFENLNNRNRVRDKKRKVYNEFLNYIDFNKTNELEYDPKVDYPWLNDSIAEFDIEYDRRKAIREAVPGAYVMERTGLTGKDLGSLIDMIKVTYDNALIGVTQDQLNYYIDTCHNTYKSGQS
jgi:hypothetical protein